MATVLDRLALGAAVHINRTALVTSTLGTYAVVALIEGVLTALADLAPEHRLKRITIVSRDANRLGAARRVAEDLLRLHPATPLMRIARERKSTRKPARPQKPTATPLAWLFVQESAAMLRVALLGPAPKATALVATRRLDLRLLEPARVIEAALAATPA